MGSNFCRTSPFFWSINNCGRCRWGATGAPPPPSPQHLIDGVCLFVCFRSLCQNVSSYTYSTREHQNTPRASRRPALDPGRKGRPASGLSCACVRAHHNPPPPPPEWKSWIRPCITFLRFYTSWIITWLLEVQHNVCPNTLLESKGR